MRPIQAFITEHDLIDERGLQAHFNRRIVMMLGELGRQAVGWDEVLHEDMPQMLVQNWRGATTRDRALARGHDCIVSAGFYLDLFYPAEMHYQYDPELTQAELVALENGFRDDARLAHVAAGMAWTDQWRTGAVQNQDLTGSVLGGEACLWSELVDDDTWPVRLWSRLPAVAERLWSPVVTTDVSDFYTRLAGVLDSPPFELSATQARQLAALGLTDAQIAVAGMLEPVKWYARLLGETALQARLAGTEMPQARPYDTTTPLTRIVDFISPESLAARSLLQLSDDQLRSNALAWCNLAVADWPADVRSAIEQLVQLGEAVRARLDGELSGAQFDAAASGLYGPHGEYLLAPAQVLRTRLGSTVDGS